MARALGFFWLEELTGGVIVVDGFEVVFWVTAGGVVHHAEQAMDAAGGVTMFCGRRWRGGVTGHWNVFVFGRNIWHLAHAFQNTD